MTTRKHLKARVRARMEKTGERYAAARAHVVGGNGGAASPDRASDSRVVNGIRHFPGIHPETAALRTILTHAGVRDPSGDPLSEPLVLVIGGGIGAGVFTFHYEKEHVSTIFLAGRHRWDDSRAFVEAACARLSVPVAIAETGSKARAEQDLRAALEHGPAIAWVDLAVLHTRALPLGFAGGAYHVVTVYELDDERGEAIIGDLAPEPIRVPQATLAAARARITAHRNRVLGRAANTAPADVDLGSGIRAGLAATVDGLVDPRGRNFSLEAFGDLARRMHGATGKDAWSRVFPRGARLWSALRSIHEYVDHYGSGGGLMRPMFAAGLIEAAALIGDDRLTAIADRHRALGRAWHELAQATLPAGEALFEETRELQDRRDALWSMRGTAALAEIEAIWARLAELEAEADEFPLDGAATDALLTDLAARLRVLRSDETAALDELRALV